MSDKTFSLDSFQSFGDLLKYLRRREHLTQLELSIVVGYSEAQIGRLEKNQRRPDLTALKALFIPALHIEDEPELIARFLELAQSARQEDAPAPGMAPYKGLLFFDESDAGLFFGREALTEHLTRRVADLAVDSYSRFLAVVGASGSGKSSLIRAGIAVALKSQGWDVRIFTPGADPFKTLEMQFEMDQEKEGTDKTLILVDQFEEVFTLCHDESVRISFIDKLLGLAQEPSKSITVIIALRADFYSHCAQYASLRQAVAAEQEYIGQMTVAELRCAIEEPARRGGWDFEPGLVTILLQHIGVDGASQPEPGALPLLSHALLATWERRRGHTLTLEGYHASGGVRGAIAETAESVFTDQLNETQQVLARDVFLRLTELGEGTEDTRRRAALNELVRQSAEATELRAVLNTLAAARLITLNEDSAEVAHEALIREWQRLHEWLTQDREGLLLHRHLTESAHEWEARAHDPSELYRGARLAQVREWASVNEERLNGSEWAFLTASIDQEEYDAVEREARRQRELQAAQKLAETERARAEDQVHSVKRLRQRAVLLIGALGLAIIAAAFAALFADRNGTLANAAQAAEAVAVQERNKAQQQALITSVRELSNEANISLDTDPELSILIALQAVNQTYATDNTVQPEAADALHRAVQASQVQLALRGHTDIVVSTDYSTNSMQLATASADGTARVWNAATGKEILILQASKEGGVNSVAFSTNGRLLATGSDDKMVRIWDVATGRELFTLSGHLRSVTHVAFSSIGNRLVSSSMDGTSKVWDVTTGVEVFTLDEEEDDFQVLWVAFSPDSSLIATSGTKNMQGGRASIWDAKTGQKITSLAVRAPAVRGVEFSPDGVRLITAEDDRTAKIWDANNGSKLLTLYGHTDNVTGAIFSPDGRRIVTVSADRQIKTWDAVTGQELSTLVGHSDIVMSVSFSPDGKEIVTSSRDKTARVWSIAPIQALVNGLRILHPIGAKLAYSPDGTRLATSNSDPAPNVWDLTTGTLLYKLTGHTDIVANIVYSPDGRQIATASLDGTSKIWDALSGKELRSFSGHNGNVFSVDFSPDGSRLVTSSWDKTAIIWDVNTGKALFELRGHSDRVGTIDYSPDGSLLVTGSWDKTAIVWDAVTGKKLFPLVGHSDVVRRVIFSPDSRSIVTASWDGTAKVWDAASGKELYTLSGHTGSLLDAAYSLDGTRIATASTDKTAKVWSALTGQELQTLHAPDGLTGVAFSPDGSQLAVGSRDGTDRFYPLKIEDLMALARRRVTRSLTTAECQQFLHTATCPAQP